MKQAPGKVRIFARLAALAAMLSVLASPLSAQTSEETPEEKAPEYSKGVKQCLACHREGRELPAHEIFFTTMGIKGDPDSPFAEGNHDCEACHGPSAHHIRKQSDGSRLPPTVTFSADEPAEKQNEVCMSCHEGEHLFHWQGSTHEIEGNACVDCHDVHAPNDAVLALETQPGVCYECHQEQRAQFLRQSRHPVQGETAAMSHVGLLSCTDCHQPHGGPGPALLTRNTINESCYDCHAEKRGPFLWEHAPVQEDCSNCHVPHGSNYENLLVGRQPYLCQQCHLANFHVSGVYSGTGIPPDGDDQRMLGKQCLNCHVQIHGSNHPGGLSQTR
jgi:DmsE family decaheme c-type cytochrome